ncbi:MAG: nucleoside phosphorylase [Actinomycetia bacterium]|nr:nucleoside phosphorylase [Actinomycetes bacterium]
MPSELRPLAKALGLRRDGDLGDQPRWIGERDGVELVATGTGIGPARAAAAAERLLGSVELDLLVVSGIAGGIAPTAVGDLVVPEHVVDGATGERFTATPPAGVEVRGGIRTGDGDDYRLTAEDLARLWDEGIVAVDMETAAIARACQQHGVPWVAFRAISDLAGDETVGEEVLGLVHPDGRPNVGAGLRFLLAHPHRIPRMVRLARESGQAASTAARAAAVACR